MAELCCGLFSYKFPDARLFIILLLHSGSSHCEGAVVFCELVHSCASMKWTHGVLPCGVFTARSGRLSSSFDASGPVLGRRERATAAWWITLILCTTSNSSSDRRSHHRARRPVPSAKLRILCSELWSVQIVKQVPLR